jgi:hypothetical protein
MTSLALVDGALTASWRTPAGTRSRRRGHGLLTAIPHWEPAHLLAEHVEGARHVRHHAPSPLLKMGAHETKDAELDDVVVRACAGARSRRGATLSAAACRCTVRQGHQLLTGVHLH